MGNDGLGKDAEAKIKSWLNHPECGYSFDRIPDQMTGFWGSTNICDFTCFKSPYLYYIESKATWSDRFDFSMISDIQRNGLSSKNKIDNCFGLVIILFASYKRAFILNIDDIINLVENGTKSINIKKIDKWTIRYIEIPTIDNNRKKLLDYEGDIVDLVNKLYER